MTTQHEEHEIILPFFKNLNQKDLKFLDIGANDGIRFSNTWDLSLLGWSGCCLEPSALAFSRLSENYKKNDRVYLYNYGISDRTGILKFQESRDWVDRDDATPAILSTLHEENKNRFFGMQWIETECKFSTFSDFLSESPLKEFDFISIDVEGHERVVLNQIDLTDVQCKLICLEYAQNTEVLNFFTSYCNNHGMIEIHRNIDNVLFGLKK